MKNWTKYFCKRPIYFEFVSFSNHMNWFKSRYWQTKANLCVNGASFHQPLTLTPGQFITRTFSLPLALLGSPPFQFLKTNCEPSVQIQVFSSGSMTPPNQATFSCNKPATKLFSVSEVMEARCLLVTGRGFPSPVGAKDWHVSLASIQERWEFITL